MESRYSTDDDDDDVILEAGPSDFDANWGDFSCIYDFL